LTTETKDIDAIAQAAKTVVANNQELREAKQKLLLTELRQQQVNAQAAAVKVAQRMHTLRDLLHIPLRRRPRPAPRRAKAGDRGEAEAGRH
jgi:hypothetical protein